MNTPSPVGQQPAKKGLSGLAIAGIGCGIIILIAIIAIAGLGMWGVSKVKEVAGEDWENLKKDPAKAGMMIALKMNPAVEIVSTDDQKRQVTFKIKQTGETVTLSYDDASKGNIQIKNSKGEVIDFNPSGAADAKPAGSGAAEPPKP